MSGRRKGTAGGPRIDLHCHSIHSHDGTLTVEELARLAPSRGLDGLAIVDHDTVAAHEDVERVQAAHPDLVLIRGCEVSTAAGHLLAYGVSTAPPPHRPLAESIEAIRAQGGVPVLSHPFRMSHGVDEAAVRASEGVAFEGANSRSLERLNRQARALARELGRSMTGGSDTHVARELGLCWTRFTRPVTGEEEALEALRQGWTEPCGKGMTLGALALSKARGSRRWLRRKLTGRSVPPRTGDATDPAGTDGEVD